MDKIFYGENVFFDNGNMGDPNESKKFLEGLAKTERLLKNQEQIIEDAQELKRLLTLNYRTKIISYKTIYDSENDKWYSSFWRSLCFNL